MAAGALLIVLGIWLVLRTVRGGDKNLVHKVLGA